MNHVSPCARASYANGVDVLIWQDGAPLPNPVAGYMAGVLDHTLLIIGGSYWTEDSKHWSNLVQMFDTRTNAWQLGNPMPEARSDAAACSSEGRIYVFGGGAGGAVWDTALILDRGCWSRLPAADLPEPRLYANCVSVGKQIYLLGGMSRPDDYRTAANTFWRWHLDSKGWETLAPLPGPGRITFAMTSLGNCIYVFGGATSAPGGVECLKDVYRFDLGSERWTRMSDLPVANRAGWAVDVAGQALLVGGYTDDFSRTVFLYDESGTVRPAPLLPYGIADAKFFKIGDTIIGTGGEIGHHVRGARTLRADFSRLAFQQ